MASSTRWSATWGRSCASRRSTAGIALRDGRPRGAQLREGALRVALVHLDAAHGGMVHVDAEALLERVERGVLDAVLRREPDDRHAVDVVLAQQLREVCALEPRVALGAGVGAGVEDDVDVRLVERGAELGAQGARDAVHRPWSALLVE